MEFNQDMINWSKQKRKNIREYDKEHEVEPPCTFCKFLSRDYDKARCIDPSPVYSGKCVKKI